MPEPEKPLLSFAEPTSPCSDLSPEITNFVEQRRKIAPLGGMENKFWMADDFDEPIDHLFNCLQDTSHDPLDQA